MWILLLIVYASPAAQTDTNGPWGLWQVHASSQFYASQAACRNTAIRVIGRAHEGMLVPIRYRCIPAPAMLPTGSLR